MTYIKEHIISFIQTFLSSFFSFFAIGLSQITPDQYSQVFKNSFWIAIVLSAVRSALKVTWQKTMPESIGGIKR